jgi:hypothetical protein
MIDDDHRLVSVGPVQTTCIETASPADRARAQPKQACWPKGMRASTAGTILLRLGRVAIAFVAEHSSGSDAA